MSSLFQIKNVVQKFTEAANAALKLDVEVINDELYRIAGAGKIAKPLVGKQIVENGVINRFLFKHKKKIIIDEPGQQHECKRCPNYGKCIYKKAVYSTIEYGGKTIGAIGFTAMQKRQVDLIESNKQAMLDFINRIANLISTKIHEYEMMKQMKTYTELMNTVINNTDRGIIILNKNLKIIQVNSFILNKLGIEDKKVLNKHITELIPNIKLYKYLDATKTSEFNEYDEIRIDINGKHFYLLYIAKPIIINKEAQGIVYFFQDFKDAKDLAYEVSQKENEIFLEDIIGENIEFKIFKNKVRNVARNDSNVLLVGKTGVGKELFARAIHSESRRRNRPFITVNCGAIPETLIESEFFGYEKGAFTGAKKTGKHGKFYLADKGTIFLDEIETMPLYLQPRLLRVIERQEIQRIGGVKSIPIDVRIVAATNVRLDDMVKNGEFRQDLFHRLNVVTLFIPPLSERGNDILLLADYFIKKYSEKFNKKVKGLSNEVKNIFMQHSWKGNVRELQNTIEYSINMVQGKSITKDDLPFQFKKKSKDKKFFSLDELEKQHIKKALDIYGWSGDGRIKAAHKLGISRSTIYRKIKKYGLKE